MNETTLNTLMPGDRAVVTRINGAGVTVRQRLLEMGLVKGAFVELIRFAPMGDPLEIRVGRYRLSLRRVEAATVIVCKEAR